MNGGHTAAATCHRIPRDHTEVLRGNPAACQRANRDNVRYLVTGKDRASLR